MSIIKKEIQNYLFFSLSNIRLLFEATLLAIQILYRKILRFMGNSKTNNYPKRAIDLSKINLDLINKNFQQTKPINFKSNLITSLINLDFDSESNFKNLSIENFSDPEIYNSINRWYWLVYDKSSLNERSIHEGLQLVLNWIHSNRCENNLAWEPYACSERISSLSTFYILKKSFKDYKSEINQNLLLKNFHRETINILTNSLEYYPKGITYNHVINNLKGLVISSILIDQNDLALKSFNLLLKELDIVVDKEGFLREGSSHYQLIFCRWICELSFFFKKSDNNVFLEKLNPYLIKILKATNFFFIKDENNNIVNIPLFGDLSPDFNVEWMISYFVKDENNNSSYGPKILNELELNLDFGQNDYASYGSYSKLEKNNWVIFIKHSNNDGTFYPSHEHQDFGSFVLFYNGKKIIVDRGRENYLKSHFNDQFCDSTSHNSITINSLPLNVNSNNHFFSKSYKKSIFKKNIIFNKTKIKFSLISNNVKRIGPNMFSNYKRVFILKKNSFEILDYVLGKKEFNSSCTFNFNVDLNITNLNKNCFNIDGRDVSLNILSYFMDGKIKKSSIADNYMNVKNNSSLLFTKKSKLMRSSFLISEK
jgi:hypothetical protein